MACQSLKIFRQSLVDRVNKSQNESVARHDN
jgi:hypothetical protein